MRKVQETKLSEVFTLYLASAAARGVKDKTLRTYEQHFNAISKRLDVDSNISLITSKDLDKMILKMREDSLAISGRSITSGKVFPHSYRDTLCTLTPRIFASCSWVRCFSSRSRRKFWEKGLLFILDPLGSSIRLSEASERVITHGNRNVHISKCENIPRIRERQPSIWELLVINVIFCAKSK